ncbi:ankyrin repeat and BTB/POZ domain-containing protein 1-like isoform X2 [Pecten maximus]|uniref:ankyrin repeat and BTB/POZ domain-containing protein 1-like isoform X2 n=1 Tax=Pecten maximus TaxID=6579 RepID=UPI00145865B8|nr:ankyrin repeat and BTB/POZ domain-containing protein 1-like isoform X2 [Pecten maximus]
MAMASAPRSHFVKKVKIDVNTTDPWDNCPLYLASLCGHIKMVKYLLKAGARYDAQSIEGQRCFLSALTTDIRHILKEYQSGSACVVSERPTESPSISNLTSFLQTMYERTPDFDVELIVAGQTFLGHKCILCVRCAYFHKRLTAPDSLQLKTLELTDPVFTPESMRGILQFLYTGGLDLPVEDVEDTQRLAAYLGFTTLANCIEAEMKESKTRKNVTVKEDLAEAVISVQYQMLRTDLLYDLRQLVMSAVPQLLHQLIGGTADHTTEASKKDMADTNTNSPIFPDICFCVGNQQFECHKMFFYGRSEFFRIMLIEKQDDQPPALEGYRPMVNLDDITEEDFVHVVSYLYQDQCLVGVADQNRLLEICDRWTLPQLKLLLTDEGQDVTVDNVMQIYAATSQGNENLLTKCYQCISENFMELASQYEFHQFLKRELPAPGEDEPLVKTSIIAKLLYHIRITARTWQDKKFANEKIKKLNYIVSNRLGYEANFTLFDIPPVPPECLSATPVPPKPLSTTPVPPKPLSTTPVPPEYQPTNVTVHWHEGQDVTVDNVMQAYAATSQGNENLRTNCYQCMAENFLELASQYEFHQFLKRELPAPCKNEQLVKNSITAKLLCHIRIPARTWQEKKYANEKIKKLNYIVSNRLGYEANFTLFDIPPVPPESQNTTETVNSHEHTKRSSSKNSCVIL